MNKAKSNFGGPCGGNTGAIFHAASSHLATLDAVQQSFLDHLGISSATAFLKYNFAPLRLRRDISALGLLHKVNLATCHPAFHDLFPKHDGRAARYRTRDNSRLHNKTLLDRSSDAHLNSMKRSLFAAVRIYNRLPQSTVDKLTVSAFQHDLTASARDECRKGHPKWIDLYRSRPS